MTDLKEMLQVVDENDREIGAAPKEQVWRQGLVHRVARIVITNPAGEVLVQRRGDKPLYPHRWDLSVAGHVAAGQTYLQTAKREAEEEIGATGLDLRLLGKQYEQARFQAAPPVGEIIMNKFATTYAATLDHLPTQLAEGEVESVQWWSAEKLRQFVQEHPDEVTDGLEAAAQTYL